ncbi:muts domain V-domain-containing protein [Kockovaella imperatae]|uniref:Muts domain V-domain-containing protein n=1 Tax=Kockovaella imperatae TaxID=4999 RepID=A0A1Y1U9E1_9TREE|nr:muts domain V-domain-containing protein [Kockovaella imperatae]ORX34650.1 muts domain V-domain-containing protein [Kockovaella imperatae]
MTAEESDRYDEAVRAGTIPSTALSRVIFRNWLRFPGCIILTKVGGFYESYFEPALELSELTGLKLAQKRYASATKDGKKSIVLPFAGFPTAQLDKYLKLLVLQLGRTVVVVDETESRSDEELKERRVGRVVTPGTLLEEIGLAGNESRFLLAIAIGNRVSKSSDELEQDPEDTFTDLAVSLAYTDVTTGDFFSKESSIAHLEDELTRIAPKEVVLDSALRELWELGTGDPTGSDRGTAVELLALLRVLGHHVSFADPSRSSPVEDSQGLMRSTLEMDAEARAAIPLESQAISILRRQLEYAFRDTPTYLRQPKRQSESAYMHIDAATLQALEIRHSLQLGDTEVQRGSPVSRVGTLLSVLDQTVTDAGHRLLVRTLMAPSTILSDITERQELVQAFVDRGDLREELREILRGAKDVARTLQRIRRGRGGPYETWKVAVWIRVSERIIGRLKAEVELEHSRLASSQPSPKQFQLESLKRMTRVVQAWTDLSDIAREIEGSMDESWLLSLDRGLSSDESKDSHDSENGLTVNANGRNGDSEPDETFMSRWIKEAEGRETTGERKQMGEDVVFWLKPDASEELQRAHDQLADIEQRRVKMEDELKRKYSDGVVLTWYSRHGYWVNFVSATNPDRLRKSMLEDERFRKAGESKKHILYKPWTVLGAERDNVFRKIDRLQREELNRMRTMIASRDEVFKDNMALIEELDMCLGFATTAAESLFVRPFMTNGTEMRIINGRHPTVEAALNAHIRPFTPNSTVMSPGTHLQIITGPNQGGKSTLLRQTAVIAILAQAGSFVPAEAASIGIVDKVFSRVGARDDLFRDRSTFMLEMVETASILKYATPRSLVIMDEIGRGTTLQAGMSIAYATLEYILSKIKCRTLFATHYHELGQMLAGSETPLPVDESGVLRGEGLPKRDGVEFWCTDVNEVAGAFSYSYKLEQGINFNSHAIKAARIAGMPRAFLQTASATLARLQAQYTRAQQYLSGSSTVEEAAPSGRTQQAYDGFVHAPHANSVVTTREASNNERVATGEESTRWSPGPATAASHPSSSSRGQDSRPSADA